MDAIYPSGQPACSRVHAMGRMEDVRIIRSRPATADDLSGRSAEPGHAYHAVQVAVSYTGLSGSDLAYRPGPNGWTYWLERADASQPWTIIDHGNGWPARPGGAEVAERLVRVRAIVVEHLGGGEELIRYGMPAVMLGPHHGLHPEASSSGRSTEVPRAWWLSG